MYKAKRDGDYRLDFLLILFFHQGKKRRTLPRDNHMAKPMQSSAITIKNQPIFIWIRLITHSQKQKPGGNSYPRAKRYEKPIENPYPRSKRSERPDKDSYPKAKRYKKTGKNSYPRAKGYEKPGKDSYPIVSMKQIPVKF